MNLDGSNQRNSHEYSVKPITLLVDGSHDDASGLTCILGGGSLCLLFGLGLAVTVDPVIDGQDNPRCNLTTRCFLRRRLVLFVQVIIFIYPLHLPSIYQYSFQYLLLRTHDGD